MAAPEGITCVCGQKATKVHDIAANGRVFGKIWTCDQHQAAIPQSIEVVLTELED